MTTHCCEFVAKFFEIFGNILAYFGLQFDWKNKNGRQETKRKRKSLRSGTSCEQGNPKRKGMCQSIQIHWNTTEFNKWLEWVGADCNKIFPYPFFQVYYFLKWVGYSNRHNSWEPEDNCNCDDLIDQFEANRAKAVLGEKQKLFVFFLWRFLSWLIGGFCQCISMYIISKNITTIFTNISFIPSCGTTKQWIVLRSSVPWHFWTTRFYKNGSANLVQASFGISDGKR